MPSKIDRHNVFAADICESQAQLVPGRVKSFSQKSGWGFIQLLDANLSDALNDIFFHRADVLRTGGGELRPGLLVSCQVVKTQKGEKASDINVIDDVESARHITSSSLTCFTSPNDSAGVTRHSPYSGGVSTLSSPVDPLETKSSSYSMRSTSNYISWYCDECGAQNAAQSIRRVMIVCAACSVVHYVRNWICTCSNTNNQSSRHCSRCDVPYAYACEGIVVSAAGQVDEPHPTKSMWQHNTGGWCSVHVDAPDASSWFQDDSASSWSHWSSREQGLSPVESRCKEPLLWASTWLLMGTPDDTSLSNDWLRRLTLEATKPEHRLLCADADRPAFLPNPCALNDDTDVLVMFEAVGRLLALAVARGLALPAVLPLWVARTVLGYPTTMEDLEELDPTLRIRAELGPPEEDDAPYREEICVGGHSRVVVEAPGSGARQAYAPWLRDVYLRVAIEPQMDQIKRGFFAALAGSPVTQTLTPTNFAAIINGADPPKH